eukprot:1142352-Pelagomonas_calceolata.AAC.2
MGPWNENINSFQLGNQPSKLTHQGSTSPFTGSHCADLHLSRAFLNLHFIPEALSSYTDTNQECLPIVLASLIAPPVPNSNASFCCHCTDSTSIDGFC